MDTTQRAIAAVFDDPDRAVATFELLKTQGFADPWLARTKPAEGDASQNDIAESSDGVLGAIGRFFTGEGNSLRRSLEDHGIDPEQAADIDETLPHGGAVVTVFADDRAAIAAATLREGGGRLVDVAAPPVGAVAAGAPPSLAPAFEATVPAEPTRVVTSSKIVSTTPLAGIDGAYEEVF
ncbi:MAG: hypothetical protein IAI49_11875, partial [Candidatus Eremiobacteraeota bacterium]|nr:hypothetical protein [Candidatus Eremiobacteraeota bacterium]